MLYYRLFLVVLRSRVRWFDSTRAYQWKRQMQTCSASFLFCINHKERNIILRLFWSYKTLLQITAGFIFKRYIHIFESNRQKNAPNNQDNHRQGSKKKLRHLIYRLFYDNWLHHSSTLLLPCSPCAVLTAQLKHTCCPLCVLYLSLIHI